MTRVKAFVLWCLAPLLDPRNQRPSGPRCMAWAILAFNAIATPVPTAIAALLLATMFGYSMFKSMAPKVNINATDAVNLTAARTHAITETITETRVPSKHDDERGEKR